MTLADFHSQVSEEVNVGTTLDARIVIETRKAARQLEQMHDWEYMKSQLNFTLYPTIRTIECPTNLKSWLWIFQQIGATVTADSTTLDFAPSPNAGGHLDDLTVTGSYTGTYNAGIGQTYIVDVTASFPSFPTIPCFIRWSYDGGDTWIIAGQGGNPGPMPITAQVIGTDGLYISFSTASGANHTVGDKWVFYPVQGGILAGSGTERLFYDIVTVPELKLLGTESNEQYFHLVGRTLTPNFAINEDMLFESLIYRYTDWPTDTTETPELLRAAEQALYHLTMINMAPILKDMELLQLHQPLLGGAVESALAAQEEFVTGGRLEAMGGTS